jgi:hypothetical protein
MDGRRVAQRTILGHAVAFHDHGFGPPFKSFSCRLVKGVGPTGDQLELLPKECPQFRERLLRNTSTKGGTGRHFYYQSSFTDSSLAFRQHNLNSTANGSVLHISGRLYGLHDCGIYSAGIRIPAHLPEWHEK